MTREDTRAVAHVTFVLSGIIALFALYWGHDDFVRVAASFAATGLLVGFLTQGARG